MPVSKIKYLLLPVLVPLLYSCAATNVNKYYIEHQMLLDSIERSYKEQYKINPFSIAFTNKSFTAVGIEILTDSLKYIYDFGVNEERMKDTLIKYRMSVPGVTNLIRTMQSIRCIWINNLDYYENDVKNSLVYMSIRSKPLNVPFTNKQYYILTYFNRPQYYDEKGRLLIGRKERRIRKINNDVFRRINDMVCYTVSNLFR